MTRSDRVSKSDCLGPLSASHERWEGVSDAAIAVANGSKGTVLAVAHLTQWTRKRLMAFLPRWSKVKRESPTFSSSKARHLFSTPTGDYMNFRLIRPGRCSPRI